MAQDSHALPGTPEAGHGHLTELAYIKIAAILAAITIMEVAIYYIDAVGDFLVPVLFVLSAIKFITVVAYFMHLKMDDRRLTWIFAGGFSLAAAIFIGLFVLQHYHEIVEFVGDMTSAAR